MNIRSIKKEDYSTLLELDKKVYPTDSPVTPEILDQWYSKNPKFGIVYEKDGKIVAMCITIPLTKNGWEKLTQGEIEESDLNSETIFNNSRDKEIALHIYHIEKLDQSIEKLHIRSLKDLRQILDTLKENNPELETVGFSGLCVTSSGINTFYNKYNCRERDFINKETVFKKDGQISLEDINSQEEMKQKLTEGFDYCNRCKMLVLFPEEESLVWEHLKL